MLTFFIAFFCIDAQAGAHLPRGKQEQYQRKIKDRKATDLPNKDAAYFDRGSAYYELNQYQKAIEDFSQAINSNLKLVGQHIRYLE